MSGCRMLFLDAGMQGSQVAAPDKGQATFLSGCLVTVRPCLPLIGEISRYQYCLQ